MIRRSLLAVLIGSLTCIAPALSQARLDRTVSNAAEVNAAAREATNGGIIRLAAGYYDTLDLSRLHPSAPLQIVAANVAEPPRFNRLAVNDSENLVFEHLLFTPRPSLVGAFGFVAEIKRSSRISLRYLTFQGSEDAQAARARGISVTDSSQVNLTDSTLTDLDRAGVFSRSQDVAVEHNHVKAMTVDGFNFAEVENIQIVGNHFESFRTGKEHPDFIQFWTNKTTKPSRNILIAENLLARGDGNIVQGILMGNEFKIRYEKVTIRDNVVFQESPHGISLYMADNVVVENNVVLAVPTSKYKVALRLVDSTGVVRNNVSTALDLRTFTGIQQANGTVSLSDTRRLAEAEMAMGAALKDKNGGPFTLAGKPVSAALRRVGPR